MLMAIPVVYRKGFIPLDRNPIDRNPLDRNPIDQKWYKTKGQLLKISLKRLLTLPLTGPSNNVKCIDLWFNHIQNAIAE